MVKKNKKPNKIKTKINAIMHPDISEIPDAVIQDFNKYYYISGGLIVAGIASALLTKAISIIVVFLLLSLTIIFFGKYRLYKLSKIGCLIIKGQCIKLEYNLKNTVKGIVKLKNEPKNFIISVVNPITEEKRLYSIPYVHFNIILDEGDFVEIYYNKNAYFTEKNGILSSLDFILYQISNREIPINTDQKYEG